VRFFLVLSDTVLRNKWKYLRDQFSVEFGKIKQPCSGDPGGESYEKKMSSLWVDIIFEKT
jgi:hypothetical protein